MSGFCGGDLTPDSVGQMFMLGVLKHLSSDLPVFRFAGVFRLSLRFQVITFCDQ